MIGIWTKIACVLFGQIAPPPYDATQGGSVDEAMALAVAIGVNDEALRTLGWSQENHRLEPSGEWTKVEASRWTVSGAQWVRDQTISLDRVGDHPEVVTYSFWCNGHQTQTLDRSTHRSLVRATVPGDTTMFATPLKFMGRGIDTLEHRSLSELLRDADDLRVRPGADASHRVVSGYVEVNTRAWFLEVVVDLSRGFVPVCITTYDGLTRWPIERLEVESLECHAGIWIPTAGVDALYYAPADDPRWEEFEKLVRPAEGDAHAQVPKDPRVRALYAGAVERVFGVGGVPVRPLSPPHRMKVQAIRLVNEPVDDKEFVPVLPDDAVVVDGLRLRASDGRPVMIAP